MELKNKCFMKLRDNAIIPTRATKYSAGYDFSIPADGNREFLISPGEVLKVKTGIAVILNDNEYLAIHIRSSLGIKKHLMLANVTGVIDSDYYGNPDSRGEIIIALYNYGNTVQALKAGERVAQGIICTYGKVTDDSADEERKGGIGSSGK